MTVRFPPLSILGALLAIAAIARLAVVVLHEPMLGIANQYDMVRTGACVGLYPDLPAEKRHAPTLDAPLVRYRLDSRNPDACYPGTEAAIAAIVVAKHRLLGPSGSAFPALREIGIVKLGFAALAILALAVAYWNFPAASALHGVTALLVMADPVVSLWFQTLYTEFPVLFGLYVLVAALVAGLLREALPTWLAWIAGTGIVMAAFAKEQFFLLPLALVAVAMPRLWATSRRAVLILGAVAATAVAWHAVLPRPETVKFANRIDAYLGVVLPASANLGATLAKLGLPERCGELAGATWYLPHGEDLRSACPEVLSLSSTAFLRLAFTEPKTLARATVRVIPATQNPLPGNLGMVAGASWGSIATQPFRVRSLLAPAVMLLPVSWYLGVVLLGLAALLPVTVFWGATLVRGANDHAHAFAAYTLMLVLIVIYALGTTVFGDGLGESARHNLPGFVAMAALALTVPFALDRPGRVGLGLRAALAITLLAALAGAFAATSWTMRQPIAIGVVDAPTTRKVPREGFVLRGWALDPWEVKAVRIEVGSQHATIGREALFPSPELASIHGGYPGARFANFEFTVPGAWLTQPEVRLRVEAENAAGIVTEIDRRRLQPAP